MGVKKVRLDKFLSDHTELTRSQIKKKVAAGLVGVNGVIIKDAGFKVETDEEIELELPAAKKKYPKELRRIAVWNEEHGFMVELLTNNFTLAASTIAAIYKARWNIEIFFRSLKQLLRIKSFIGTTRNAVEIQIWTALITMLILTWLKHIAKYKWAMANLVVSLRLNTFTKINLNKWLDEPFTPPPDEPVLP